MSHRPHLENLAWGYGESLLAFVDKCTLPNEVFSQPPDHIGLSVSGMKRFNAFVLRKVLPLTAEAVAIEAPEGFVVEALLKHPLDLHDFGQVDRLRVLRRDADGSSPTIDYVAMQVEDLSGLEQAIRDDDMAKVINYGRAVQPYLIVKPPKNSSPQIRLIDLPQRSLVAQKIHSGEAKYLDPRSSNPLGDLLRTA